MEPPHHDARTPGRVLSLTPPAAAVVVAIVVQLPHGSAVVVAKLLHEIAPDGRALVGGFPEASAANDNAGGGSCVP